MRRPKPPYTSGIPGSVFISSPVLPVMFSITISTSPTCTRSSGQCHEHSGSDCRLVHGLHDLHGACWRHSSSFSAVRHRSSRLDGVARLGAANAHKSTSLVVEGNRLEVSGDQRDAFRPATGAFPSHCKQRHPFVESPIENRPTPYQIDQVYKSFGPNPYVFGLAWQEGPPSPPLEHPRALQRRHGKADRLRRVNSLGALDPQLDAGNGPVRLVSCKNGGGADAAGESRAKRRTPPSLHRSTTYDVCKRRGM